MPPARRIPGGADIPGGWLYAGRVKPAYFGHGRVVHNKPIRLPVYKRRAIRPVLIHGAQRVYDSLFK